MKHLSELLEKGYSLNQGIEFLQLQLLQKRIDELNQCMARLKEGEKFHQTLADMKFNRDIVGFLYFADHHGDMPTALREGGEMAEKKLHHYNRFVKVIRYPIILLLIVAIMFWAIQTILLPQFQSLYSSMNVQHSFLTAAIFKFLAALKILGAIPLILIPLLSCFYVFRYRKKSPSEKIKFWTSFPLIKKPIILFISYYFSTQLSSMLKGGLSIYESLMMFEKQSHLPFYKQEAAEFKKLLSRGERLEQIIRSRAYFEKELAVIIAHGQSKGTLDRELQDYSHFAIQRLENKMDAFLNKLQPLLFSSIGIIILSLYLAIMLPLFKLISSI